MEEVNHCKYCGEVIPDGQFCCKSCFDDFEDCDYDQETEYEDWDD